MELEIDIQFTVYHDDYTIMVTHFFSRAFYDHVRFCVPVASLWGSLPLAPGSVCAGPGSPQTASPLSP